MATDTNQIVKQGTLKRFSTSEDRWVEKHYVLYRSSELNASRLDYYDSIQAYKSQPMVRKTVFVEEIVKVERLQSSEIDKIQQRYGTDVKYIFKIEKYHSGDKPEVLSASTEQEAKKWIQSIHELVLHARTRSLESRTAIVPQLNEVIYSPTHGDSITFNVEVDDTAASNLCELNGKYTMILTAHHVTLFDERINESVLTWEYCNIRRYGFGSERFTLEGGRNAGRAAGLFMFKNCLGANISTALQTKMIQYQQLTFRPPAEEYIYVPCQPAVSPNQPPHLAKPRKATNGVSVLPPSAASAPPLPNSPPMPSTAPATAPKPKVAAKNLGLNLNGGALVNNNAKSNGSSSGTGFPSGNSSSSSNSSTPISPMANGGYVGCKTTSVSSPPLSATGPVGGASTSDCGDYVNQKLSPNQSLSSSKSSLNEVRGHPTTRKVSSDASSCSPGQTKMSEVLEKLRRMKSTPSECSPIAASAPVSDEYEHIELIKAGNSRLANSDISLKSAVTPGSGREVGLSDPSHVYGPIQSPAGLPGSSKKSQIVPVDSEYAEIGYLS